MPQSQRQPLTDTQLRASPPQVALDATSLAALESITAVVSGAIELGATTLAALETIGLDASTLSALETTDLGATTLAALENITATISGEVSLDAGTLAALETIGLDAGTLAALETIELGATTLAALESITVSGTVTANAGSGTMAVSGPLTDAQLAARLPLSVEQATSVDVADGGGSLTVDNAVLSVVGSGAEATAQRVTLSTEALAALETTELGATTLAALETINAVIADGGGSITVDDGGTTITVDGTVALDSGTLTALETIELGATTLAALESITVVDGGGSLTVDGPATDAELRATPLPVSGTVTASGPLTDTQLRASAVSVEQATSVTVDAGTGPFPVSDNSGSLTVDAPVGTPAFVRLSDGSAAWVGQKASAASLPVVVASDQSAVPVSGTFYQATQPVSGTVTANAGTGTLAVSGPLTNAQLSALLPLSVEQATSVAATNDQGSVTTGNITSGSAPNDAVSAACTGYPSATIGLSGTYALTAVAVEGSDDGGSTYPYALPALATSGSAATQAAVLGSHGPTANTAYLYLVSCIGMTHVRLRAVIYSSGTGAVRITPAATPMQLTPMLLGTTAPAAMSSDALNTATKGQPVQSFQYGINSGGTWDRQRVSLGTSSVTNVAASATSVQLLASTTGRKACIIQNDGTSNMYLKLGTTATATTSFTVKLAPGGVYELPQPIYTGRIDAIWTATGGNGAAITELT